MLKYKGYTGILRFDETTMIFHGEIIGLKEITFHGATPSEIKEQFEGSIERYLNWCHQIGQQPALPYSSNIQLRQSPFLQRAVG